MAPQNSSEGIDTGTEPMTSPELMTYIQTRCPFYGDWSAPTKTCPHQNCRANRYCEGDDYPIPSEGHYSPLKALEDLLKQ